MNEQLTWAQVMVQLVGLLVGGGAVWAYLTRRRETDAERISRYEGRIDTRLELLERDNTRLQTLVAEQGRTIAVQQHQIDDAVEERDELRLQNRLLIELLRRHGVEIPPELLTGYARQARPDPAKQEEP